MKAQTASTQAELDAALADASIDHVIIDSPAGVWLSVRGSSHVEAWESSHVEARGSSHVVAWESSHVVARGSSHVVARGSSHVVAWGSSHVEAWGSSHVVAWGSSHVEAWESSHVEAGTYVAVHLHSASVTLAGGVVIDMTEIDLGDPATWVDYHGIRVDDDHIIVWKAVDAELNAGNQHILTAYPIGESVAATDWRDDRECGQGLHFGPSPSAAGRYFMGDGEPRYLACSVALADIVPLGDKIKAPSCVVLYEADVHGDRIAQEDRR